MKFKKILAFTLAEVLITMTIVGAIAAMTIPTLINKRVQTERSAKLRKFYSRMTNAIDLMGMNGQSFKYLQRPGTSQVLYDWYIANLDRYMGHKFLDASAQMLYFADGSSLSLKGSAIYDNCWPVLYDTNGAKLPNSINADQYYFVFCYGPESRRKVLGDEGIFFGAYGVEVTGATTDEKFIESCKTNVKNNTCTRWLQNNNWEYPENYPLK